MNLGVRNLVARFARLPRPQRRAVVGACLMSALAVLAQVVWLPSERAALAALSDEAQRLEAQGLALSERHSRGGSASAAGQGEHAADAFRARFPATAGTAQRTARLLALAQHHALTTRRADFSYSVDATLGVGRYRVSLPVQGSYLGLRSFVADALAADPALQLDSVSFKRADARAGLLDAELQYTLLSRVEGWVRPASTEGSATPGRAP